MLRTLAVQSEPSADELSEQQKKSEKEPDVSQAHGAPDRFEEVGFDAVSVEDISGKDLGSPVAKYVLIPLRARTGNIRLRG